MTVTATPLPPVIAEPRIIASIRGSLQNPAGRRRREWCPIAVPIGAATLLSEATFVADSGLRFRATRCEDVGEHSTIYRVFAPFAERQSIEGSLVLDDGPSPVFEPFTYHPWVKDSPKRLIPRVRIQINGIRYVTNDWLVQPTVEFANGCMQRWHGRAKLRHSGFLVEIWTTFYHRSPVADVRVAIVWSDRNSLAHDLHIDGIEFVTGEICKFDFHTRNAGHAYTDPAYTGTEWVNRVCDSLGFIDGSFLPLFGRMLCLPQQDELQAADMVDPTTYNVDGSAAADLYQDIETLHASHEAPVFGLAAPHVWDGRFLACRNLPRFSYSDQELRALADMRLDEFDASMKQPAGWYAARPRGLGKNPGQTGDQQDFGAQKGWEATQAGDARWLQMGLYSVSADAFRGIAHYEVDGTRLNPLLHPSWVTWSWYTHFSTGQSPDRLGKPVVPWGARTATTWGAYDEEHRSQKNFAAVYALTGDPLLRFIIEHQSTTDICDVRYKRNFGYGAPRAAGRRADCFSDFALLADGEYAERYRILRDDVLRQVGRDWQGGKTSGPVKILADRNDPRIGITRNGVSVPAWNWEHGIAAVGFYSAWKSTGEKRWLDLTRAITRTIVRYGTLRDATGEWWICSAVASLPDGQPLPESDYVMPTAGAATRLVFPERGGTATWVLPAILIFIECHEHDDPDMERAREIVRQMCPTGESYNERQAEWWACVRQVPPVPGGWRGYHPETS